MAGFANTMMYHLNVGISFGLTFNKGTDETEHSITKSTPALYRKLVSTCTWLHVYTCIVI